MFGRDESKFGRHEYLLPTKMLGMAKIILFSLIVDRVLLLPQNFLTLRLRNIPGFVFQKFKNKCVAW